MSRKKRCGEEEKGTASTWSSSHSTTRSTRAVARLARLTARRLMPQPPPPLPPRRPPTAARPDSLPTSHFASTSSSSSSPSMFRTRALAKVNKLASQTSEFVSPRLESAKESAAGKLANLKDAYYAQQQQTNGVGAGGHTESDWATSERVLAPPKKALRTRQVQGEFAEPSLAAGGLRSRGMTPPGSPTESRTGKWAAGIGSYFSTNAAPVTTASSSATGTPSKGKGKALLTDDIDEERIVCFPGVRGAFLEERPDTLTLAPFAVGNAPTRSSRRR